MKNKFFATLLLWVWKVEIQKLGDLIVQSSVTTPQKKCPSQPWFDSGYNQLNSLRIQ